MNFSYADHSKLVHDWVGKATRDLSSEQLLALFDNALERIWKRARLSMSAVMLKAVFDRVLFSCTEKHPLLFT
jgi:hypothetical protein